MGGEGEGEWIGREEGEREGTGGAAAPLSRIPGARTSLGTPELVLAIQLVTDLQGAHILAQHPSPY